MFLSMGSPCSSRSRHSFRGQPWSRQGNSWGRQGHFPFFAMEVDPQTPDQDRSGRQAGQDALEELLTNPLEFISALASAAAASSAPNNATGTESCRKRKEAEDKAAAKKARFEVKLNVEGYKPEEMNIKLVDNALIISGSHEHTDESGTVTRNFTRTWNIPENVQLEELACNFNSKDNTMNVSAPWRAPLPPPVTEKVIPIHVLGEAADKVDIPTEDKTKETPTAPPMTADNATDKQEALKDPSVGA